MNFDKLLIDGAKTYGIDIDELMLNKFIQYKDLLLEWNKKINLTAITDEEEIAVKHFVDSLTIAPFVKNSGLCIIDIGTGAGFPSIPLNISQAGNNFLMVDSLGKRVVFLNEVIKNLQLEGIQALHSRAEDLGKDKKYREFFDVAVARAVAGLPVLLEYCLPFVKIGGSFIAMKGSNIDEIEGSRTALKILGGDIENINKIYLPGTDICRNIIEIRKIKQTPTKYPRKAGKPSNEPLQ